MHFRALSFFLIFLERGRGGGGSPATEGGPRIQVENQTRDCISSRLGKVGPCRESAPPAKQIGIWKLISASSFSKSVRRPKTTWSQRQQFPLNTTVSTASPFPLSSPHRPCRSPSHQALRILSLAWSPVCAHFSPISARRGPRATSHQILRLLHHNSDRTPFSTRNNSTSKMGAATQALYYFLHPQQLRSVIQWYALAPHS